jgi:hypothetical protein
MRYALMASIAPSERLRRELDQIVAAVGDEHDPIEMIDRLRRPADPAVGARGQGDRLRELKARYRRILDEAGPAVEASAGLLALAADYRAAYPSAAAVIKRELDALVCHLLPPEHRKRIRSTNLLDRTSSRSGGGRR